MENYTYDDGTVNWLPACADVDSIINNETLFKEHNIDIQTDCDSFIAACEAFEEDKREAYRCGMNGHLAKPINVRELMKELTNILG